MYYKVQNASITLGGNTILEDINFYIKEKEKIGILGRNGCGKTTLLKAITGEIEFSDGYDNLKIETTNDFKIGYVKQNISDNLDITMSEYILSSFKNLLDIEEKLKKIESVISMKYDEISLNKYNSLLIEYEYQGGYKYLKEYEIALKKFGFTEEEKSKKLSEFSGGKLTKLSLIHLLLSKPDLLILDEPTNHLDISAIEWLEEYLKNYNKSIILVSHDRMFLDNVCNVIYDIEYGSLKRYNGNYTCFVKQKQQAFEKHLKDYELQQKEIKRLQAIADRFRYKPTKAKMALSKLKQIERMIKIYKPNKSNTKTFSINYNPIKESFKDVLKVKNLSIGYEHELCNLTFNLEKKDKIGIIGNNGTGKSTLVKTLAGEIPQISGKYIFNDSVTIGYFSQSLDNLKEENTVYDEIDNAFPIMSPNEIRTLLGSFGFSGEAVFKKIKNLSGGEKVRVSLCKILNSRPNVLILDEPTNHLDIINKETLEKFLKNYNGTIIMVSHDRYLIKNVCNKLLVLDNGESKLYNYGYQEYLDKKEEYDNKNQKKEIKLKNKTNYNISNNINKLEKEIEVLEKKIKEYNEELFKEEVYTSKEKSISINNKIELLEKELKEKLTIWENSINL